MNLNRADLTICTVIFALVLGAIFAAPRTSDWLDSKKIQALSIKRVVPSSNAAPTVFTDRSTLDRIESLLRRLRCVSRAPLNSLEAHYMYELSFKFEDGGGKQVLMTGNDWGELCETPAELSELLHTKGLIF